MAAREQWAKPSWPRWLGGRPKSRSAGQTGNCARLNQIGWLIRSRQLPRRPKGLSLTLAASAQLPLSSRPLVPERGSLWAARVGPPAAQTEVGAQEDKG